MERTETLAITSPVAAVETVAETDPTATLPSLSPTLGAAQAGAVDGVVADVPLVEGSLDGDG